MLDIVILTLFPEMFVGVFQESMMKRACAQGAVRFQTVNFRDYATDKHHTVDDYPFGGGAGMLLKAEPICSAINDINQMKSPPGQRRVVLLSPQGRRFNQQVAQQWAAEGRIVFICGHYEGIDDRVRQLVVTDEVSLGDFVLTGGEIAAMAVSDAIVRLLPGVLGNEHSANDESFSSHRLEYPQYTRPPVYAGLSVPSVLTSGHHQQIASWRALHALYRTWVRRPDLLVPEHLTTNELAFIRKWEIGDFSDIEVLYDKQ